MNAVSRGLLAALSPLYGCAAAWRRRRAPRRPDLGRRLRRPVISVGNLAVGGRGKTPVVVAIASLLRAAGERPAVQSRGYARELVTDGVLVVRTAHRIEADVRSAGDEPMMLARALDGVAVLVAEDRHAAACLAETHLGCTVHVLDDGFQHLRVARDVDLLVVTPGDLHEGRPLPGGWLREPVESARAASALLVTDGSVADVVAVADTLGVRRRFEVRRHLAVPRMLDPSGTPPRQPRSAPALAVAGIARPDRFFDDLVAGGWNVVARASYPDHHRYSPGDVEAIAGRVRASGAAIVLTTGKDAVRWEPLAPLPFPLAWVPLEVSIEPADAFAAWILSRVRSAAEGGDGPAPARDPESQ